MEIGSLPEWVQPGFKGMKALNRIQSRVCECALYSSEVRDAAVVQPWLWCGMGLHAGMLPCAVCRHCREGGMAER